MIEEKNNNNKEFKTTILVVDDEPNVIESYRVLLEDKYNVLTANNGREALDLLQKESVNLVLLDVLMPDMDGLEVLKKIKETVDAEVVMVTAVKTVRTAIQAMKLGAYDYVSKPFDVDDLLSTINKVLEKQGLTREIIYLRSELKNYTYANMVGNSEKIRLVFNMISEVSSTDSTILITGESGTGKELIARAIHNEGLRRDKPFIAVDCATIPDNLVESELFGHEKGSFTDATSQKIGKFELANNGTLLLDEIGNLKLDIQSKILRVLEEKEIQRVGSVKTVKINTRIISATNIDLKKAVNEGKFRQDLFYRLNVIPIFSPALRDRKEDIPGLVDFFISMYNKEFKKNITGISKETLKFLVDYNWPGNIRELRNIIERLVALSKETVISHRRLPIDILLSQEIKQFDFSNGFSLKEARSNFEKQFIIKVLEKNNWNQTKAAAQLGIHRNALIAKINAYSLHPLIEQAKSK